MTDPTEIKKLAYQRLKEAEILINNQMCDGAFYLAGYSVEMILKAKICDRLGIPNLFDEATPPPVGVTNISEIRKPLKTHNLFTLIVFSGLKVKFDIEKARNINMAKANSLLFNGWDETVRYKPCGHMKEPDVKALITVLGGTNGILKWIENS